MKNRKSYYSLLLALVLCLYFLVGLKNVGRTYSL